MFVQVFAVEKFQENRQSLQRINDGQRAWRICVVGAVMGLALPAVAWVDQAAILLLLCTVPLLVVVFVFWLAGRRSCAAVLIGVVLLMPACTNVPPEATAVADLFVRAYFVEDNVAAAAKHTSGAAKSRLDGVLRQIEATGLKEPAKDKPRVKVTPVETQSVSADVIGYVYRSIRAPGIQPITAKLRLSKNGNTWSVSEFRVSSWIGS